MTILNDPDMLVPGTEITYNYGAKTFALAVAGNLTADGVTGKALYSHMKDHWRDDTVEPAIAHDFPMLPITDEQFIIGTSSRPNGWAPADATTRSLIRTAGWQETDNAGAPQAEYACIITLGSIETGSTVYYQQTDESATKGDFANDLSAEYNGAINESLLIWDTGNDYTTYLALFARELGDTYDYSNLDAIGVDSGMTYQAYRFPLTTANDPDDGGSQTDNTDIDITYLAGTGFTDWASGETYGVDEVVRSAVTGRWHICTVGGVSGGDATNLNGGSDTGCTWVTFTGEREIGGTWYAYNVIVDADVNDSGADKTKSVIYEQIKFDTARTQGLNIDAGGGTRVGNVQMELAVFSGPNLVTLNHPTNRYVDGANGVGQTGLQAVYIDDFLPSDQNDYRFTDIREVVQQFPSTVPVTITWNDTLETDAAGEVWVWFTDATQPSGPYENDPMDFNSSNAVIVQDDLGTPQGGVGNEILTNGGGNSYAFNYAYDENDQRGASSVGDDAYVTVVAIGSDQAQYYLTEAIIEAVTGATISLVSPQERNYIP